MANRWGNSGNSDRLYFGGGPKITADGDCSHEIKRHLFCGSAGKESACNEEDLGLIPGLGRYPGEGKGYPLQYSGLERSMDCMVHGVTKSQTRLNDFHFHFAPWKKSYDQPDSILKNRDVTLPTKIHLVKAMVFPVTMYRCESWTIKKAEWPKN